ncbi:hypothetical protein P153DRAFT_377929 [Dothidotthia symphoricarpi CBS 119687]|uniref:Translation initiation factor 3 N-terminal domain-containing protein n=1 Tax=Dothidotthia symphoricarpi CBS 119687 TaxID=1392245 RepID=A0A6A6A4U8_9PLEO|nr:uncharacterized protein P153DRAFT_377929 [Dothidotthia symphoricarpi CBS 119687]KAF2127022.1 hypothetical protein P153DRAFT_377929 [Dothidotthia symphoricarpi CBS 119687]
MPPTHISSTSRALYRVFIAPNLRTNTPIPLQFLPAFAAPTASSSHSLVSRTTVRTKTYTKDTRRHALSDHYILDAAITSPLINFVDEAGKFYPSVPLTEALTSFNKITHHLVQMAPGNVDGYGRPASNDPADLPTCRVISKISLREQFQHKLETLRRQEKGQPAGPAHKNLELNWAIAGGDLKHRLEKMKGFLRDGRKVEIMLGPKKRGKQANEQEANAVLNAVREAVEECKGASVVKSEGTVGGVMTIVFEGRKTDEKKISSDAKSGEGAEEKAT